MECNVLHSAPIITQKDNDMNPVPSGVKSLAALYTQRPFREWSVGPLFLSLTFSNSVGCSPGTVQRSQLSVNQKL